ncbi:MAG: Alpha-D-kanosaminyltransferase [Acidobacteriaceae bacterium]|nr:Alpha-D-kanosaminyltransferase [Acidobacteriaceae bacterium]
MDCYFPTPKSSAKLVHDLGAEFRDRGHEVIILAPAELISGQIEVSIESGMQIVRVKSGKIKGATNFHRALNEIRLSNTLWKRGEQFLRSHPCNLIVFYSPSIFFGALVRRLKALWNCPSYLILRDIFPQWAVDTGILRRGVIYQYFRRKELEQYAAADVIGVQSPAALKYFSEQLSDKNYKLEVVLNWTTLNQQNLSPSNFREQLGLKGKVVFFYGGNIGVAQDMDNIVRLAASLKIDPRIHFLLVGEGSEVDRLNRLIHESGLKNMKILPSVSQSEYWAMLSEFDVGLISLDRRLQTQNIPGKLLGYMYHSMPILASLNPENDLQQLLEECDAGLCSLNGEDEKFQANALKLCDPELRKQIGRNARKLLERDFSVTSTVDKILAHVRPASRMAAKT